MRSSGPLLLGIGLGVFGMWLYGRYTGTPRQGR
jgi:hypothetical protein